MNKKLIAVVLAGGGGTRFWPFTTNKTIFPFLGKRFVDFTVLTGLPNEVTKVVFIAGSDAQEAFQSIRLSVPTITVVQRNPLGMADALLTAKEEIQNASLLVVIADDFVDSTVFQAVIERAQKTRAFGVIPGYKTQSYFPGGYLRLEGEQVKGMVEKPEKGREPSPFVAVSGQYLADSNAFLEELKRTQSSQDDVYEKVLAAFMARELFEMVPYGGPFVSLKFPWQVLGVMDVLLGSRIQSKKGRHVDIGAGVVMEGNVEIGDNVKIFEHTKIVGPCYIGNNTVIGNNNIIRASHIGDNCVTGFNTDITRSYIGDNCWFHSNYIGDSVLEGNVSMGAGAVLANLRLDDGEINSTVREQGVPTGRNKLGAMIGKNVRIGVNASIMPGVKIGAGSFIGSGVVVDKDVPEQSFCILKESYTVKRNNNAGMSPYSREEFKKQF